jgi:mono/diheme cytochrome c family protein
MLAAIGASGRALAQDADAEFGKREFLKSCSSCHGETGKGDGPAVKSLGHPAADLTKLAKNNNGVFPIVRVYNVIDGRIQIIVHGSRQMPAWGEVYTQGLKDRMPQNFMSKEMIDALVRERILMLVEYVLTLQEK